MDSATDGNVLIDGQDIAHSSESQLVEYRRAAVGFVFQFYNLVPNLTALENVELASQICPDSLNAAETLCRVGLEKRLNNFPAQLSGGEQQRVAIARALAKTPSSSCATSPQEPSITAPANRFFSCCKTPAALRTLPHWSSPTTLPWPLWPTALSA